VRVALDGVEVSASDFNVDDLNGTVTFIAAPAAGVALTAGFEFDIPVRFLSDRLDIELDSFDAGNAPSIPVIEVRE
jgi:uncharacterized protein (TIGR02217 family)